MSPRWGMVWRGGELAMLGLTMGFGPKGAAWCFFAALCLGFLSDVIKTVGEAPS